jgi:cytochrome P450
MWNEMFSVTPYIRAIADEVHRHRTVLPVGSPHFSTRDVFYKGYRIPKDTAIFMNTYGIYNNPDVYEDPHEFKPERFLKTEFGTKEGVDKAGYGNNLAFELVDAFAQELVAWTWILMQR